MPLICRSKANLSGYGGVFKLKKVGSNWTFGTNGCGVVFEITP